MLSSQELRRLQREQHAHDMRNHFDIISLHKTERLKHYGLHFAKYVGRLARESTELKPIERTLVDALLVGLSTANTLHQDLSNEQFGSAHRKAQVDPAAAERGFDLPLAVQVRRRELASRHFYIED